jgi:hypothetical protein
MDDVFCIKCRYDSEFSDACRNPKGIYNVKTPWRLEQRYAVQTEQNKNNDCPWFESKESYKPEGIKETILWKLRCFFR